MITFPNKDSSVNWIGEVPGDWQIVRAKYVFREVDERSQNGAEELLSVSHLTGVTPRSEKTVNMFLAEDYSGAKLCRENDFVFNTMWAWMGALGCSPQTGIVSSSYGVYRLLDSVTVNPWYLDLLLRTPLYIAEYNRRSTGVNSSRLRLYPDKFLDMSILLPPKNTQDRIVAFLDAKTAEINEAIAKKERLIELLHEQKAILINRAVTQGLNPAAPLRDSGVPWIGQIPCHWAVKRNLYIFSEQISRSEKGEELHLSMSQKLGLVPASELDVQTLQSESYEGAKLCWKGDLVLNRLKAHLAVFSVAPCDGLVSSDYSVFRLTDSRFVSRYFENLFKTPIYLAEFNRRVRGIVIGFYRLYSSDFKAIPSIVPPAEEQLEIVEFIAKLNHEIMEIRVGIENEIEALKEFRTVLISEAVTGKIKI